MIYFFVFYYYLMFWWCCKFYFCIMLDFCKLLVVFVRFCIMFVVDDIDFLMLSYKSFKNLKIMFKYFL